MPSLRNSLRVLLMACFVTACFVVPHVTLAANSSVCECFCGDVANGAQNAGSEASASACSSVCAKTSKTYVGCYKSEDEYPVHNDKCWTESECTTWTKTIGSTTYTGSWGGQNQYCSKANSGAGMGYCYGPDIPVNLNIAILGKTSVSGLPEYLATAYNFLIPALALVAVVMLMVGGLGYATARGNSKAVDKAKSRITNALIGLILLLSAYAIASFIDPRLVNFDVLKVPLVKQVVLLDQSSTCETLADKGYVISPPSGTCGKTGTISSIDNVEENVSAGSWKVGSVCNFSTCSTKSETCFATSTGNSCMACNEISSLNPSSPSPSEAVCSAVQVTADAADTNDEHLYYCFLDTVSVNQCVSVTTYGETSLNCAQLRSDVTTASVLHGADPCSGYDNIVFSEGNGLGTSLFDADADVEAIYADKFKDICTGDPCGLAELGGVASCTFVPATIGGNCTSGSE